MTGRTLGALFASIVLGALALLASGQKAEALTPLQPTPPEHYTLDPRGVDLVTGEFSTAASDVVIGQPGQGGIVFGRIWTNGGWRDNLAGTIQVTGSTYAVSFSGVSELFTKSGSVFTPVSNTGSTLTQSGTVLTYTRADGTIAVYSTIYSGSSSPYAANNAAIMSLQHPDGQKMEWFWNGVTYCAVREPTPEGDPPGECLQWANAVRPEAIRNNQGYQIKFLYALDTVPEGPFELEDGWLKRTGAMGINLAVDYCHVGAGPCTGLTRTWPSVSYTTPPFSGELVEATDQSSRTTIYTYSSGGLATVRLPGSTVDDVAITYNSGKVSAVTDASGAWTYGYVDSGTTRTTTASGPLDQKTVAVSDQTIGRATSIAVQTQASPPVSQTTTWQYDSQRRLERITNPEGDYTQFTYDGRGNIVTTTAVPKSGSGLSNIVTSSTFPSTCANPRTCNKPSSTTDALGKVTDYTWDSGHGGVLTVTLPAPAPGAVRPQSRYTYAAQTAYFKNSGGTIVAAATSVTLPTVISACATGTSCANAANEVRSTITYGSTGVANNLLPTTISEGSGASPAMAVAATTYTPDGDVQTTDGPLPGTGDTALYRYDNARQLIGVVGPDPDAGGPLLNRAQRYTYNSRGQITLTEVGTTPGYTDPNWASFAPLQRQETVFDAYGRPVQARQQSSAGVTHALQQFSYDGAGRAECSATRMNSAMFGGLPSACTLGTAGSFGPDQIVQMAFDAAGRVVSTTSGVGTAEATTETVTYTANGQPATLVDGNGNVSIPVYDGFDRVSRLRYPNATCCGTSTTDYDEYTYDAGSNVVSYRNRGGDVFALAYDALNRLTKNDGPVGTDDVEYAYDNLGRTTCASLSALPTCTNAFTYDALGRQLTETGPLGAMASQFDAAGRRTRLTWPDAVYVTYDYDLYGAMTQIKENGSTVLATYAYDDQGRRAGIARGNGVPTTYGYDAISRLTALTQNPAGAGQDLNLGLSYSPGSQITGRSSSNQAYVFAPVTGSTTYANNGRNQVTSTGAAVTYDGQGNITGALGNSYGYDDRNRLVSAGAADFQYDPLGRLSRADGAANIRFQYDGQQAATEYNASGAVLRRHVPGPSLDETVVSYAGSGTSTKTWPLVDERGSVIALTDGSGAAGVNRYDEYGVPASGNAGRFQYTGQMWLEDAGVYHYRARAYAPTLGRFLQTDPIRYGGGANLYSYVGADPVNLVDPLGLLLVPSTYRCFIEWWERPDGSLDYKDSGCEPSEWREIDTSSGRAGGGGGGGDGTTEAEQKKACSTGIFARNFRNAAWQRQMKAAMSRAINTPSRGPDGARKGSEVAFMTGWRGGNLRIGNTYTSYKHNKVNTEDLWIVLWFGYDRANILVSHTHQFTGGGTVNSLSDGDIMMARNNGIAIMAQRQNGERYCYDSNAK